MWVEASDKVLPCFNENSATQDNCSICLLAWYPPCVQNNIKLGFITSTSVKNINSIKNALKDTLDFSKFVITTSIEDIKSPKPNSDVYSFALNKLGLKPKDVFAIEDTKANQSAALELGINCFLHPGEYALVNSDDNPKLISTLGPKF